MGHRIASTQFQSSVFRLAWLLFGAVSSLKLASALDIQKIVVFGDSFSDQGNIFAASDGTQPDPALYFDGRYSNGRIWNEFVASFLDASMTSYAWGGATTNNNYIPGVSTFLDELVPSVADQVDTYLQETDESELNCNDTAHLLLAGYNDYWWYVHGNLTSSSDLLDVADRVTTNLIQSAASLVDSVAEGSQVLVGDLPNMQDFPDAIQNKTTEQYSAYGLLTTYHNSLLREKIDRLAASHPSVKLFSSHDLLNELVTKDVMYGYVSTNVACIDNGVACADPFSFMFWDDYHPTTQTHYRMGRMVYEIIVQD